MQDPATDEVVMDFLNGLRKESKARDAKLEELERAVRELKSLNGKMGN